MKTLIPYWTKRALASDLFEEMDRFFNGWEQAAPPTYDEKRFSPAYEIAEADEHFVLSVDLPGLKKEDIKIEVTDNVLSISGERKSEILPDNKLKVQRYEKSYGYFKRSFSLPANVDSGKVKAQYENGVLELYLPKQLVAKPRQIEIHERKETPSPTN